MLAWKDVVVVLYICGSWKFMHEMNILEGKLKEEKIHYTISKSLDSRGILACLEKINEADVVYVSTQKATLEGAYVLI